ncbi:hypothetical protein [Collimonas antrihumi]|uniref:hypothetical protein n=1 Tax=Collimonas antrihumi TaxID=1940615 RepID=UPI001B8B03C5|nr:hypothetical protein [Collimonas antrihumi]
MKVAMTDKVRVLQKDPVGAKALRVFIATAKLNQVQEIKVADERGNKHKFMAKLVPAQG